MANQNEVVFISSSDLSGLSRAVDEAITKAGGIPVISEMRDISYASVENRDYITRSTAVILDFTTVSSNVIFEAGVAQALGKPIIPLAMNFSDIPANLQSIQFLIIAEFTVEEFTNRLASLLSNVIKNPENYTYESVKEMRSKKQSIFISYSHSDKVYLERLLIHMRPLHKQGMLALWADTHLRAGDKWKVEIQKALECATAAVLIISADFLASDFVVDNELPPLLRGAEENGTRIIPLIAKPCRFTRDPNLKHFQSINDPKDALILLDSGQQEKIFDALCAEVERYSSKG